MKRVKNSLGLMLCSLLSFSVVAADKTSTITEVNQQAVIDFYGKLNISLQASEEASTQNKSFNELKSNASRVGVKGKYYIDHGLTAIYKLEWQVNVNDGSKDSLTARSQWVGIKGGFGELTVGRADTTLKVSQGKFDLFNDYEGDLKQLFIGENRLADSLTYKSPMFSNVHFRTSYIISDVTEEKDPYSVGVFFGDMKLKKTDFFLSVAHDENMPAKLKRIDGTKTTVPLANTRVTGMYQLGDLRLGAMFVDTEISTTGKSETGYAANVAYKIGKVLAKVAYQEFAGADSISIGADYKLAKKTKVYAWYTDRKSNQYTGDDVDTYKPVAAGTYFAVGMEQKF